MSLNKLHKSQIEAVLKGNNVWNSRVVLRNLSERKIKLEQCGCTQEEYESYVKRAQLMIEKIKNENKR